MSEIILPPEDIYSEVGQITRDIEQFGARLSWFVVKANIPVELICEPDHAMIKSADAADFEKKAHSIKPFTEEQKVAFMELDERFLIAARLIVPMLLRDSQPVGWLEVMESNPADYIGTEYVEFYHPDYERARKTLADRGIGFSSRNDDFHRYLRIPMNKEGQEVRISDSSLQGIIDQELQDGTARLI